MEKDLLLAHDLGTTGNKATLFNTRGELIASAFQPYETFYPHIGWAEQNPEDWWEAFRAATIQLLGESKEDPELLKSAPHVSYVRRLDETNAARNPILRWEKNKGNIGDNNK